MGERFDVETNKVTDKISGDRLEVTKDGGVTITQPKTRTSKLAEARTYWATPPKCVPRCDPATISKAGSNAEWTKSTCLKRGWTEKSKREPDAPVRDPSDCRGSTKTTHRVFCLDCQQVVGEVPQELYKQHRKQQHERLARGITKGQMTIHERVGENLTAEGALKVDVL